MDRNAIPGDCATLLNRLVHLWQRNSTTLASSRGPALDAELTEVLHELVRVVSLQMVATPLHETMPPPPAAALIKLTRRERDVLCWLANGKSVDEVSTLMQISKCTVRTYIQRSLRKLDVSNRTHAVTRALRFGLIDL